MNWVSPISSSQQHEYQFNAKLKMGSLVSFVDDPEQTILTNKGIGLIGIDEHRGSREGSTMGAPDLIREQFYKLAISSFSLPFFDFGNIPAGNTVEDTHFALSELLSTSIPKGWVWMIIGGSHDLTYAQFKGHQALQLPLHFSLIDRQVDIDEGDEITSKNFLSHILTLEPNFLLDFSLLAYQSYFVDSRAKNMLDNLNFEMLRLGSFRADNQAGEALLRNSDLLSVDFSALKHSDFPAVMTPNPNGLYGEEACQLMRFAGQSDRITSVGLYGFVPQQDVNSLSARQAAQMIWYFLEGISERVAEDPGLFMRDFREYIVHIEEAETDIHFLKSLRTQRWWMAIPTLTGKNRYLPCTYLDYQLASRNEIPDRWLKHYAR